MNINAFFAYLMENTAVVDLVTFSLVLILLIFLLLANRAIAKLKHRYIRLTGGSEGKSLEEIVVGLHEKVNLLQQENTRLSNQVRIFSEKEKKSFRGMGIVRFNAFLETGGDMSFAVALVNSNRDGLLITGIYGREDSRTYAKRITSGKCNYRLMNEEQKAIRLALQDLNNINLEV